MNIEIHDAALEARIRKQLQVTGSRTVEEVLLRLLETQEEQDRWLSENRDTINAKIRRIPHRHGRGRELQSFGPTGAIINHAAGKRQPRAFCGLLDRVFSS